jgi:hypothetical protein
MKQIYFNDMENIKVRHVHNVLFAIFLVFVIPGCGFDHYLLSKEDLSRVTDRLSMVEKQLERQTAKTELLLEQIQKQEDLLQQTGEKTASAFEALQDQVQQSHQKTENRFVVLQRSLQKKQVAVREYQQPVPQKMGTEKLLIGRLEKVLVSPPGQVFHARIDTGATTSSLDARDIRVFERDGREWIHFQIQDPENKDSYYDVERPIARWVRIIQAASEEAARRPVVKLQFQISRIKRMEEFTLEDRSHMDYQVLIGRNILRDLMVVDVARKFIAPLPQKKSNGKNQQ